MSTSSYMSDVDELKRRIKNEWADVNTLFIERAVGDVLLASTCLRSLWTEADISSVWCKDDVTYDMFASRICSHSTIH